MVMIHLVPHRDGVEVPQWCRQEPVLRLNVAYGFNLPGFEVNGDGVYAVLSFNRQDFPCWLPWESIFGLTLPGKSHEGVMWPQSAPRDMQPMLQNASAEAQDVAVSLRVIDETTPKTQPKQQEEAIGQVQDDPPQTHAKREAETSPARGSHLRLVKG